MAEQTNRWSWDVTGFDPWKSSPASQSPPPPLDQADRKPTAPLLRRYSISATSVLPQSRQSVALKLNRLKDKVKLAREDYMQLRQEANELQEYSNAKLDRVTRYLGVLAEKTRKLDQVALETEARIAPLINEKRRLFNDLLTSKGNIRVFCRARPLFEDEGPSVVEFPDGYTISVNTGDESSSNAKKDFEFDRVYGPHVGQAELFSDVQPLVQSALDGYNVSILAYGQTLSGKTHTMEGSSYDRGLYARCFEELFDLSNLDKTSTSQYKFCVTVCELYNEQTRDLLLEAGKNTPKLSLGSPECFVELVQEKVDNPLEFSAVLKTALQTRENDLAKNNVSHLIVTVHIFYNNLTTGENSYSKLYLVDLAGSEGSITEDDSGDHVTDLLHVMKSLSALGDVLSSLTSKKDIVPYENSVLTKLLADSLGGSSKTLMIVNVCPSVSNLSETLSSLNFSARARNSMLSLGNRDTIKKWRDVANDARKELYDKEKEINDLKQEGLELKQALKDANDQCVLLFNEVQKAWKVSSALQTDLKSEHEFLSDKHNIEKEQNTELRNQVAQLLRLEQDQKLQIQEQDSTIQSLQAKIRTLETQLNESIKAQPRSIPVSEPESADVSNSKLTGDGIDSSAVTRKLEEELKKRDALIERLHEENEKLFDRLTQSQKASTAGSPKLSSPLARGSANVQPRSTGRNGSGNNTSSRSVDVLPSPLATDKNDGTVALVKTGSELVKSTPAGEYLTAALNDFDPDQYEGHAAISDGANKLLMLVLAAVIKAGASREHEILAEIRDSVFSFIRKMEPKRVMDTMLVSRVRILYIRSLLARSPELQSIKVLPVECFLEKTNTGRSRSSSRGSSPGRSPVLYVDEQIQGFKVNLKPEKKSKFSSVVLKIRGIDEDIWRQQVTGGKLREITEEAKSFAMGNKALAALFVHTPAGELQRQIRSWLGENFEFLSVTGDDASGGSTGQLELLSTAIMDGWMAGLGAALPPHTDALGQLLFEYSKRVYTSQLQHLKDIAGTLAQIFDSITDISLFLSLSVSLSFSLPPPKMAPPAAAVEGGQAPQGRQQQAQGGFGLTGIIRMVVFWYFASKFFSPKKPTEPSALISNLFQKAQPLDMWLYLSENEKFNDFGAESSLVWHETNIPYAVWGSESTRTLTLDYNPSESLKHNGSLYAHVFFAHSGFSPDPSDPEYQPQAAFGRTHPVVMYLPKSKADRKKSLLGSASDSSEAQVTPKVVDDPEEDDDDSKDEEPVEWVSYWKPNITINLVADFTQYPKTGAAPNIAPYLNIDPFTGNYYPIVYFNEFWLLRDKLIPLNETVTELRLNLEVGPISMTKWQLFLQIDQSFQIHRNYGSMLEGEADELKRVFLEGNPYLLAITMVVSLLHSVFDFLAFKNDIQFWNKNKSMEGLSAKTVVVSFVCQLIIFLYLLDNDTSWMILASSGIGCIIEFWKIGKAMRIEIDRTGRIPMLKLRDRESYVRNKTKEYDDIAVKYLCYVLFLLVAGFSVYSLMYERHKSWYSWILSSLTSCVYMFGFIMMCPQLFINYKLKSVAHLPWRQMTYKFLNTIIDDLFAFVIKMPTLHRLSVFRDDLIFLIYLYQRWIYPVDKKRVNEFGFGGEDDQAVAETGPAKEVTDPAKEETDPAKEEEKKTK